MTNEKEAGNVLIYILGAIFLLGLLAVTVRGSNTPGAGIDQEQLLIRVAEIQEYGHELEQAVAYIMQNGHSEADIRFAHPNASSAYGDITDTPSRQVFARDGGGATYRAPPAGIQATLTPWVFTGQNHVPAVGTDSLDILAILPNVSKDFCLLINDKNDIENPLNSPPADPDTVDIITPFTGSMSGNIQIATTALIGGNLEGCFEGGTAPPAGTYHYYRVLLAR